MAETARVRVEGQGRRGAVRRTRGRRAGGATVMQASPRRQRDRHGPSGVADALHGLTTPECGQFTQRQFRPPRKGPDDDAALSVARATQIAAAPSGPAPGEVEDRAVDLFHPPGWKIPVTHPRHGRILDVPPVLVTDVPSLWLLPARHSPAFRPSPTRLPGVSRNSPRTPGRLGHGHSLPGPWPRRPVPNPGASSQGRIPPPGASFQGHVPFPGANFPGDVPFPGRQLPGPHPVPPAAGRQYRRAGAPGHTLVCTSAPASWLRRAGLLARAAGLRRCRSRRGGAGSGRSPARSAHRRGPGRDRPTGR